MSKIDVFYQGEQMPQIEHCDVDENETLEALKALLATKHGGEDDALIFLEDGDAPVDEKVTVGSVAGPRGVKIHRHRCQTVDVKVHFGERTAERKFSPATTIAKVKRWAAEKEFKMTEEEGSEHVLQITGTHDRPRPGTHLGTLTSCPRCSVSFDLLPDVRVNGAYAEWTRDGV